MQRDGLGRATAARRIKELGVDIAAFMRHHYQQDAADPHNFDIVVNSGTLTIEAASDLIIAAYRTRFGHLFETQPVVPVAAERTESSRVDLKIA
jgi:hypothetical protein